MQTGRVGRRDSGRWFGKSHHGAREERWSSFRRLRAEVLEDRRLLSVDPFPVPLTLVEPLGSLIYDSSAGGQIDVAGEIDRFTVELDADQTMTVVIDPDATLRPVMALTDPGDVLLDSTAAAGPGQDAVLQVIATSGPGTYSVVVGGAVGSTGAYRVQLVLNAAVEAERHDGPTNDDPASAEDLEASFISLPDGSAERGAVLGSLIGQPGGAGPFEELLVNGGFETGDFTGWTAQTNGRGELTPWTVQPPDVTPQLPGRITEVGLKDPDFVEIQNLSTGALDTRGWVVVVNDASDINTWNTTLWDLPDSIAPGEVLYRQDIADGTGHYWGDNISWQTFGPGWVMILDEAGAVVDFAVWVYSEDEIASFDVTINGHRVTAEGIWSGQAVPPNLSDYHSLQRVAFTDHDDATDWLSVEPMSKGVQNSAFAGGSTFEPAPLSGAYDAYNGFEGEAGLRYELFQDVAIPPGTTATLTTNHRIRYAGNGTATQDRVLEISIGPPGGASTERLHVENVDVSGPAADLGWNTLSFDVSAYAGSTVRILFSEQIPESYTGASLIEFDDVSLAAGIDSDWYRFDLADGESVTLALRALTQGDLTLELYDGNSTLLAVGTLTANLSGVINNFLDGTTDGSPDTYYVRVTGTGGDYSLLAIRDGDFDTETSDTAPNDGPPPDAQDITLAGTVAGAIGLGIDPPVTFAAFGDFGRGSQAEADVAGMVQGWEPDLIITTGDNNYGPLDVGGPFWTFNVGNYYGDYMQGRSDNLYPEQTSPVQRFFPTVGNHDSGDGGGSGGSIPGYLDYFHDDPAGGRLPEGVHNADNSYYDFRWGPIHFFAVDSDHARVDPDSMAAQQDWLQNGLANSTADWKFVYFHHAPFSSALHGENPPMQWPFQEWGADVVFSGHDHTYERLHRDGVTYFVTGLGGGSIYWMGDPIPGSAVRYNDDYGSMRVTVDGDLATFEFLSIEDGDNGGNGGRLIDSYTIDKSLPLAGTQDYYRVEANTGDLLTIETGTPGDGPLQFVNELDPTIELYDPTGALVAGNDNGAGDGRNARLTHAATISGTYTVRVTAADETTGEYVLSVAGHTGDPPAFEVSAVYLANEALLPLVPPQIAVQFSETILAATLDAWDLTVDGVPAAAVTVIDGDTAVFDLPAALAGGQYDLAMAAGAVLDLQRAPIEPLAGTITIDTTPPRVIASSVLEGPLLEGSVVPAAGLIYTAQFSKGLSRSFLSRNDMELAGSIGGTYRPTRFEYEYDPASAVSMLTVEFADLPEDTYTLTLYSGDGRFEDLAGRDLDGEPHPLDTVPSGDGTAGGDFVVNFSTDTLVTPYPGPLLPVGPRGSLIYDPSASRQIGYAGDTDGFTIDLDPGQTISVVVDAETTLQPTVELFDPGGLPIGAAMAAAPGEDAVLQVADVTGAGVYTVTVGGQGDTTGWFTIQLILNAAIEQEEHGGPENGDPALAQDLDASFLAVDGGPLSLDSAQRGAVLGTLPWELGTVVRREQFRFPILDGRWSTYSSDSGGRVMVTGEFDTAAGPYALMMDRESFYQNRHTLNEAIWTVDLSGLMQPTLTFYEIAWLDYIHPLVGDFNGRRNADGVAISDDGTNWHPVWDGRYETSGVWQPHSIDLAAEAAAAGITLGPDFHIKFQQFGNRPLSPGNQFSSGRGFDEITITTPAPLADDWYRFTLDDGQTATLALTAHRTTTVPTPGEMSLELVDGGGNLLARGIDGGNVDRVIHNFVDRTTDGGPDTYFVRLTGQSGADYSLLVTRNADFHTESNLGQPPNGQPITASGAVLGHLGSSSGEGAAEPLLGDDFAFQVRAGDVLLIDTATPGGGPGEFVNRLDPAIELIDPAGTLVAQDANGDADGRNARLVHNAVLTGAYTVRVLSEKTENQTDGEYLLRVAGHTGALPAFEVATTTPADAAVWPSAVTQIRVAFHDAVLLTSLDASDLTVDSVPAVALAMVDAATAAFELPAPLADGPHDLAIAGGAILDLQGTPIEPFAASFVLDTGRPNAAPFERLEPLGSLMSASSDNAGRLGFAGDENYFTFFAQAGAAISAAVYPDDPAVTLSIELTGLAGPSSASGPGQPAALSGVSVAADGIYTIRVSGDAAGTFMLTIGKNLVMEVLDSDDGNELPIDGSLTAIGPGSQADTARYGVLARSGSPATPPDPFDLDKFTVDLTGQAGVSIDIVLAGQQGANFSTETLQLLDTDGFTVLATAAADPLAVPADNYDLAILDFVVPADGIYTLRLMSTVGGRYGIVLTESLVFDSEPNSDLAGGDPLRSLNGAGAALGYLDGPLHADLWEIDLAAGDTLVVHTETPFDDPRATPANTLDPALHLLDASRAVLAFDGGTEDGKNGRMVFSATVAGTYTVMVSAEDGTGAYRLETDVVAGPLPRLTIDDVEVIEGDGGPTPAVFTVRLSEDPAAPVTVQLDTFDDTATVADGDYAPIGGLVLQFDPGGDLTRQVAVDVLGDARVELRETFFARLSNAAGATIADPHGVGGILNDDASQLAGRYIFYNDSAFDGNRAAADAGDDAAIATDKVALMPGQTATFANYTSFAGGINGVMVDIAGVPAFSAPRAGDFRFRVGNSNDPLAWDDAPEPTAVALRRGAGAGGSDRVSIVWPNGAIQGQWLQVTVLATVNTGLAAEDTFYFGNAIGESGNSDADARVNAFDMLGARDNQRNFLDPAPIDFDFDFNRDRRVDVADVLIARSDWTHFLTALKLITAGPAKAAADPAANIENRLVRDVALRQVIQGDFPQPAAAPGRISWLAEFEQTQRRPSRSVAPTRPDMVDWLVISAE